MKRGRYVGTGREKPKHGESRTALQRQLEAQRQGSEIWPTSS